MRIGTRISAGFGVVVALSAMVGIVGWISLDSVVSAANATTRIKDLVMLVKTIHTDITRFGQEDDDTLEAHILQELDQAKALLDTVIGSIGLEESDKQASLDAMSSVSHAFSDLATAKRGNAESLASMIHWDEEVTAQVDDFLRQRGEWTSYPNFKDEVFALRLSLAPPFTARNSLSLREKWRMPLTTSWNRGGTFTPAASA